NNGSCHFVLMAKPFVRMDQAKSSLEKIYVGTISSIENHLPSDVVWGQLRRNQSHGPVMEGFQLPNSHGVKTFGIQTNSLKHSCAYLCVAQSPILAIA